MIEERAPDIVFLDIKMPGLSGIDVASKVAGKCLMVFITAYDRFAVEAFENEAVDYLLKPVADERLEKMIERLKRRLSVEASSAPDVARLIQMIAPVMSKQPAYLQWIRAQHKEEVRLISVHEIYFFQAADRYTVVRTREGEFLIRKTIRELADELDPSLFWRIHRGAIVNAKSISKVGRSLTGRFVIAFPGINEKLTVSRSYSHLFKSM